MRVEVTMPRMGQGMEEGTILSWLKEPGAAVKRGEPLFEIESDKATVEIESFASGTLSEILVPAGATAAIGTVIATIEAEARADALAPVASPPVAEPSQRRSGVSPVAQRVASQHGVDLTTINGTGPGGRVIKDDIRAAMANRTPPPKTGPPARLDVSPVARKLARQHGLDLAAISGSAPNGRVIKRDILAAVQAQTSTQLPELVSAQRRVPLTRLRRIAARRMAESKATVPHFYLTIDVDMTRALDLRESLRRRGKPVTVNDLVLKAAALALVAYPSLNATYDEGDLILHDSVNLAVAVAVGERTHPDGLVTPVVHGCESMSMSHIAGRIAALAGRARENKLTPEELSGGTFSVSNLGMYGIRQFQAIINPPQVAILAVGAAQKVAAFDEQDRVRAVSRMTLTLSADHRATDGAEAAGFLSVLQAALEDGYMLIE